MSYIIVTILLAAVGHAHSKGKNENHPMDVRKSIDMLADKLVGKLLDRMLNLKPAHHANWVRPRLPVTQYPYSYPYSSIAHMRLPHGSLIRTQPPAAASTAEKLEAALVEHFEGEDVSRVIESFMRVERGEGEFKKYHEGEGLQVAGSYVPGLTSQAFYDVQKTAGLDWLAKLEKNYVTVLEELKKNLENPEKMEKDGVRIWATAADEGGVAYGPEWRTLVLMDRGRWDLDNIKLFPKTAKLLDSLNAPASEVFFARQTAGTGIKPHTDNTNFILTGHLGLEVPEGDCWIEVGEHRKGWEEGKAIAMDTSMMHSTENNTGGDRYVLIVRFWHPELSVTERTALQFVFDALDFGFKEAKKALPKKRKKKPIPKGSGGFR
eukprot:gnl/MRDRNA2_/MRDRNA2_18203_c0_seq1.p1 gnl/MRDRNA2_/MRDRNA2_18203_c0~~gnl/MRDRNA2_/MRDRNA2_18203_c0_seq1.p1  ORF type:complete len:378 (-),score=82.21 gnl/MRDRNA2_/MRDRNA2_18203_c0_seq1:112-1245(-)